MKTLASRAGMSLRNFKRVFQREAGMTPADFVEMARVDSARRLLEDTDKPLQRVASSSGFVNPDTMRRAFLSESASAQAIIVNVFAVDAFLGCRLLQAICQAMSRSVDLNKATAVLAPMWCH